MKWKEIRRKWFGTCFGISVSNALAFEDRTNFVYNFPQFPFQQNPSYASLVKADDYVRYAITQLFSHQYGNPTSKYIRAN
jgi:hypothetical protein